MSEVEDEPEDSAETERACNKPPRLGHVPEKQKDDCTDNEKACVMSRVDSSAVKPERLDAPASRLRRG